jgi:hypothetical protein
LFFLNAAQVKWMREYVGNPLHEPRVG